MFLTFSNTKYDENKLFCLFCLLHCFWTIDSKFVTRNTINGKIRGKLTHRTANAKVEQYLGIPYAAPPIGNLRFERPEKPKPWKVTLDTLDIPHACPQKGFDYVQLHVPGFDRSSEDCLYLNVYVPRVKNKSKLPVLLYIHGGSNEAGMGAMFDGDVLASYGRIIVVTFNYRLGILGFIAAIDHGLEGNYGFLDQIEAMKWVQNNIHFFGGDPGRVTIHGHSAGAADVGFHLVSTMSKGLFRYAILHSGSPLAFWAMTKPDWRPGYNIIEEHIPLLCHIRRMPLKKCLKLMKLKHISILPGRPTIGGLVFHDFPAAVDGSFLIKHPEEHFKVGNFSGEAFLLSFTKSELAEIVISRHKRDPLVPLTVDMRNTLNHYQSALPGLCNLTETIYQEYGLLEHNGDDLHTLKRYIEVESDFHNVAPIIRLADMLVDWTDDMYLTSFDQHIGWTRVPKEMGPAHGRDLFYIFGTPFIGHPCYTFSHKDREVSILMMKLYSSFVKYGFLTLDGKTKYRPYDNLTKVVHSLGFYEDGLFIKEKHNFRTRKMKFWNEYLPRISSESQRMTCGDNKKNSNGKSLNIKIKWNKSIGNNFSYSLTLLFLPSLFAMLLL